MADEKPGGVHTVGAEVEGFNVCIRCGDKTSVVNSTFHEDTNYVWLTSTAGAGRKWEATPVPDDDIAEIGSCEPKNA